MRKYEKRIVYSSVAFENVASTTAGKAVLKCCNAATPSRLA